VLHRCRACAPKERVAQTPWKIAWEMSSGFNELELLSQEDLVVETLRKLLNTYHELGRREEVTKMFLSTLCGLNQDTWIWYVLWEAGSAQRFTDLLPIARCGRSKLSKILSKLLKEGLIRRVEKRYQAVSPAWLVRI